MNQHQILPRATGPPRLTPQVAYCCTPSGQPRWCASVADRDCFDEVSLQSTPYSLDQTDHLRTVGPPRGRDLAANEARVDSTFPVVGTVVVDALLVADVCVSRTLPARTIMVAGEDS